MQHRSNALPNGLTLPPKDKRRPETDVNPWRTVGVSGSVQDKPWTTSSIRWFTIMVYLPTGSGLMTPLQSPPMSPLPHKLALAPRGERQSSDCLTQTHVLLTLYGNGFHPIPFCCARQSPLLPDLPQTSVATSCGRLSIVAKLPSVAGRGASLLGVITTCWVNHRRALIWRNVCRHGAQVPISSTPPAGTSP